MPFILPGRGNDNEDRRAVEDGSEEISFAPALAEGRVFTGGDPGSPVFQASIFSEKWLAGMATSIHHEAYEKIVYFTLAGLALGLPLDEKSKKYI